MDNGQLTMDNDKARPRNILVGDGFPVPQTILFHLCAQGDNL